MASSTFLSRFWAVSAAFCIFWSFVHAAHSVSNTVLIFARDASTAESCYSGLKGYGIPYQVVLVPQTGITMPALANSPDSGNYGAIVVHSEVAYQYPEGFRSALTPDQWLLLYDYQTAFGVRMVRIDVFPGPDYGVEPAIPNAAQVETQHLRITNAKEFPTAGVRTNVDVPLAGLYHNPAKIINASIATEFAQFTKGGPYTGPTTAGVINRIGDRQQMAWFTSYATQWSVTSNFLQHAWIHWVTRGLYLGFRRIYFSTQVDDMFLLTDLYQPKGATFRTRPADLDIHLAWQQDLNKRLPPGSKYYLEIGHNGNGNIEASVERPQGEQLCIPGNGIDYAEQADPLPASLEYKKPKGTGKDIWPATPASYAWSLNCAKLDDLMLWFQNATKRDQFAHVSHTFSHANLDNGTRLDSLKEVQFNVAWLTQVGLDRASMFSRYGLIPPAITGLHNADAIQAWMENKVQNVVGDNTRPALRNKENDFWPLISTVDANGYAGLNIVPRWSTSIYYNCDFPACTLAEWIATSGGKGTFEDLLEDARQVNARILLGLHQDPFMFHQANLRVADVKNVNVNGKSQKLSLLQAWTETVLNEITKLVSWPIMTLKMDDIGAKFLNRMTLDKCKARLIWNYSEDRKNILSVTATTEDGKNQCGAEVPVTFPKGSIANGIGRREKVGGDPLTIHFRFTGQPVTFELAEPLPV